MTAEEAIALITEQGVNHERTKLLSPGAQLIGQWLKSITAIDKSQAGGFSLIGEFATKKQKLEPGLFFLYSRFLCRKNEKKRTFTYDGKKILTDEEGVPILKEIEQATTYFDSRAILFDFDGENLEITNYIWLPTYQWAEKLWQPVEYWIDCQPRMEAKIDYWEAEVATRKVALEQAQERLKALKHQYSGANEELAPEISEWLQTAAVLGGKKSNRRAIA
ncbi:MAG: hypothetical protein EAZ28_07835 [Oscillatoriales cyanobacterium]|nr:MAG: hypothetical protein EAZ28_07835 [Oscillatoriales cyanobacterium]